ncbi:MAG: lysine biosynthesis enzyme LysX, partial [Candidatus Bathyarchaeia archaeon]
MNKIGLICDRVRWDEKSLIKAASKMNVKLNLIDPKAIYMDTSVNAEKARVEYGDIVIQRCISYFRGLHITAVLENSEVFVINPFKVSLVCGNKL